MNCQSTPAPHLPADEPHELEYPKHIRQSGGSPTHVINARCDLPEGHDGMHVARRGEVEMTWPSESVGCDCEECVVLDAVVAYCAHDWEPGDDGWDYCAYCGSRRKLVGRAAADELARLTDEMGLYRTNQEAS